MKRKKFVKTVGFGIAGTYAGIMFTSCKKDSPVIPNTPSKEPIVPVKSPASTEPVEEVAPDLQVTALLDGYSDKINYNAGEELKLYTNTSVEGRFKLTLNDANNRVVGSVIADFKRQYAAANSYENGSQYKQHNVYKIPATLKSGVYFWGGKLPFVVKNPKRNGDIVVVFSSNTDNAYNAVGGKSAYTTPLSPILSYQRPYVMQSFSKSFWPWATSLPYNIDYVVDSDLDDYQNFSYAKMIIIVGHSEYWTRAARENFDKFVESGKDALVLSGNTMWWQVRYSEDGTKMICYKSTDDPIADVKAKTVLWTAAALNYPIEKSIGANFDLGGFGNVANIGWGGYKVVAQNSPILNGTNLKNGDIISMPSAEYDGAPLKTVASSPYPVINNDKLKAYKAELVAYNEGFRGVKTMGTVIALQKNKNSGVIINVGTTDWCSPNGMGGKDGELVKKITLNSIDHLLNKKNVFSS